jgi:hypothetical protein
VYPTNALFNLAVPSFLGPLGETGTLALDARGSEGVDETALLARRCGCIEQ